MKRENTVFKGGLKDKELYLIEDALIFWRDQKYGDRADTNNDKKYKEIENLIMKLYQKFAERP